MDDQERVVRVRDLRARGFRPKEVAMALGVSQAEASRLVRLVAREDASTAPEPPVVGCWVSPGWSKGLVVPADWPDSAVPDEGKPFFIQGVRDDPVRIMRTLERSVGPGNFHFTVAV